MGTEIITKNVITHIKIPFEYFVERVIDTVSFRVLQKPYILKHYLEECGIIGAQVLDIKLCFGTFRFQNYFTTLKENLKEQSEEDLDMAIELDTPITMKTDKGTFEFEFVDASTVFFTNSGLMFDRPAFPGFEESIDIRTLFSSIIGQKIVGYEIEEGREHSFFTWSYGLDLDENQSSYIWSLSLIFEDGKRLYLYADFDWFELELLDKDKEVVKVKCSELIDKYYGNQDG